MVIIKLQGGLGNQMFQYAAAKALALCRNEILMLDQLHYANYELRNYSLHHFNIKDALIDEVPLFTPLGFKQRMKAFIFQKKIFNKYDERGLTFDDKLFDIYSKNLYLNGYFQSEKYFKKYENQIRDDFKILSPLSNKTLKMLEIISRENAVSLHIRRGDYVTNPEANAAHGTCNLDYYERAVGYLNERIRNLVFFVFSDDIQWAKANLKVPNKTHFVDFNNAATNYEDLKLMSSCNHHIIANSSFSWWGAWLNNNNSKIVIAPQKWFNTDSYNSKDIIPVSWISI